MLSGKAIAQILGRDDPVCRNYYRGVYGVNTLHECVPFLDLNSSNIIVVNTDKVPHGSGKHWLLVHISTTPNTHAAFVDSLDRSPEAYSDELGAFLDYYIPDREQVPFPLQSPTDNMCGYYAIYFANQLCRGRSVMTACKRFKETRFRANGESLKVWFMDNYNVAFP